MSVGNGVSAFAAVVVLGGVGFLGVVAEAADLKPVLRSRSQIEPQFYATDPAFSWTGYYAGGYLGGAHGVWTVDFYRNNNHGHAEQGADGVAFGAFGGYNYQFSNNVVIGVEADIGYTNAKNTNEIFDNDDSLQKYGAIGSVRGRLGYAFNRLLLYSTAGFSFANITNNIQKGQNAGEQVVWENQFRSGWALGGGVEYAFTNRVVWRIEYLYNNFGSVTLFNQDGNQANFKNELHLLRVGATYRF
jgi:outer membrane immunogenic protein